MTNGDVDAWGVDDDESEWMAEGDDQGWGEVSPELAYIHDTLIEAMTALRDRRG